MKTIALTLYTYDELEPKAQAKAREWAYESASEDFDSFIARDLIKYEFIPQLEALGFSSPRVHYSGFWSQGDGASFMGTWSGSYLDPAKLPDGPPKFLAIRDHFVELWRRDSRYTVRLYSTSNYSHEHSVSFDFEHQADEEGEKWMRDFREVSRNLMRHFYALLEAAFEDSVSDETLAETLRANEYHFTADGTFYPNP